MYMHTQSEHKTLILWLTTVPIAQLCDKISHSHLLLLCLSDLEDKILDASSWCQSKLLKFTIKKKCWKRVPQIVQNLFNS